MEGQRHAIASPLANNKPDTLLRSRETARLDEAVLAHLGDELRGLYGDPAATKLPHDLRQLAHHLSQVIKAQTKPVNQVFIDGIMGSLPALRAYALSLTRDNIRAEDLIQSTVLKAISNQDRFVQGTNLRAWLFTVMRNEQYSQFRARRREIEDVDGGFAETLISLPEQEGRLLGQEVEAAIAQLSADQRSVLLLVGVEGVAYEDAAKALGCTVGTIKSRLSRARNRLAELLKLDHGDFGRGACSVSKKAADELGKA